MRTGREKVLRRARAYEYKRRRAFITLSCSYVLWSMRYHCALAGIRPKAMRGKTAEELSLMLNGQDEDYPEHSGYL